MKTLRTLLLWIVSAPCTFLVGDVAAAEQAPYVILGPPSAHAAGNYGIRVTAPTYAYGWFGVQPRRHWSRHFGYYRNYTQWSGR
jgi:hypothetical protein